MIDKSNYHDHLGKTGNVDELKGYIQNIYVTLMTRGIKGTYIYACDPGLREYLKKYF
ncbi:DNA/RNA helicase domain-containing protein [Butyrivibrio sp. XBB1001]|uniref:DNA/RNA helicase domain-containing protein n=1 Tax=Butyrivibrio sp. XBB1001 TaxID=1280682 RepID=UPI0004199239|nr:DNA/RNA helicase domain-containing protein [uncultured Butyrivibrio sp.]